MAAEPGFTIVQAGSSLQAISPDGATIETLTLPVGVTIDATIRGQFHIMARQLLFTRAPSVNLWIDPVTFTVRPMVIEAPSTAPVLAAGGGTGLTGDYVAAVAFAVLDGNGDVINESSISPLSNVVTLADEDIDWSSIPVSLDSAVNARVLYRSVTGANGESLFQRSIITDNVTTMLSADATDDTALGLLPVYQGNDPPPGTAPGTWLELSTTWQNRMLGVSRADPDELLYTQPDQFYAWPTANGFFLTVRGEDKFGCQGFLPRRDDLVILKRSRVLRLVGSSNEDFELIPDTSGEGIGCQAPFSCVVIDDLGYFLGWDGVYRVGPQGVECISRGKVDPWFQTDDYFDRSLFPGAIGAYNPVTNSYELHFETAALTLGSWVAFDINTQNWYGRHETSAFVPTARGLLRDADGQAQSAIGGADGYVYWMNQPTREDAPGDGDPASAIDIDWLSAYIDDGDPDSFHYWGQASIFVRQESGTPPVATITSWVGNIPTSGAGLTQNVPLTIDRTRLARFGSGRTLRFRIQHPDSAGYGFMLQGLMVPTHVVGRR
jgi:hypothetical protein